MKKRINQKIFIGAFIAMVTLIGVIWGTTQNKELKAQEKQNHVDLTVDMEDKKIGRIQLSIDEFKDAELVLHYTEGIHIYAEDIGESNFPKLSEAEIAKLFVVDDEKKEIKFFNTLQSLGKNNISIPFSRDNYSDDLDVSFSLMTGTEEIIKKNIVWEKKKEDLVKPDNVFTPVAVPYADVSSNVSNWEEFIAALDDDTVTIINVLQDISNTSTSPLNKTIARNLVIQGVTKDDNNNLIETNRLIDFGSTGTNAGGGIVMSNTATAGSSLTLNSLTLKGVGGNPASNLTTNALFVSTGNISLWTLNLQDVSLDASNTKGVAYGPGLSVEISGQNNNIVSSYTAERTTGDTGSVKANWQKVFECKSLLVKDGAVVSIDLKDMLYASAIDGSSFVVEGGSKLVGKNENTPIIASDGQSFNFFVGNDSSGKSSSVSLTSNNLVEGNMGGMITVSGDNAHYLIDNSSTLDLHSYNNPTTVMYSSGGVFDVKNSSTFRSVSDTDLNVYQSTIRFRIKGNATFNISEDSRLYFVKGSSANASNLKAAALRLSGDTNAINISGGSRVYGENHSKVETFQYTGKGNSFNLSDYGSKLQVTSENSGGINSGGSINIQGTKGTEFQVSSKGIPFNGGSGSILEFDEMLYYDFRNNLGTSASASEVFNLSGSGAALRSVNSDMSVWMLQSDLDGNPYKSFTLGNIGLEKAALNPVSSFTMQLIPDLIGTSVSSSSDMFTFFNASATKIDRYARVNGNNSSPIVDSIRTPTNADKYVIGHASVPEGVEGIRDAWDDEVTVKVKVTKASDGSSYELTGNTSTQSIYGETSDSGIFKIPNITTSGGEAQFLETGDKVEVLEAWRGGADASSDKKHLGVPTDDDRWVKSPVTTEDVTPPTPTKITGDKVTNASKTISGTGAEPGSTGYVGIKSSTAAASTEPTLQTTTFTVAADGSWTVTMPDYFTADDKVSIFLQDHAGLTTNVLNPPPTNKTIGDVSGNINPYIGFDYHDATFLGVNEYVVEDIMPEISVTKDASSSGGLTTSVGDVLTYTIKVSNSRSDAKDTQLNDVSLIDVIPDGLVFDSDSIEAKVDGVAASSTDYNYDDSTKTLTFNAGTLMTGKVAELTFNASVSKDLYEKTVTNKVTASGKTIPGDILTATATADNPGGSIAGTVELVTVPTNINFGTIQDKAVDVVVNNPTVEGNPLEVKDTRGDTGKTTWSLSAKVTKPMTLNGGSNVLVDALKYKYGADNFVLSESSNTTIFTKTNGGDENITSTWSENGDGLKLDVSNESMEIGDYTGEITWTLGVTP